MDLRAKKEKALTGITLLKEGIEELESYWIMAADEDTIDSINCGIIECMQELIPIFFKIQNDYQDDNIIN